MCFGLIFQFVFTRAAKQLEGLASIPMLGIARFIHSTSVVPEPQNGSRTVQFLSRPSSSINGPTNRSEYPRMVLYQSCISPFSNRCRETSVLLLNLCLFMSGSPIVVLVGTTVGRL